MRAERKNGRAFGSPQRDLTVREVEILGLVADGLTNAEIGRKLWLAESTVKVHMQRIMRALGVTNRWGAVGKAFRQSILR